MSGSHRNSWSNNPNAPEIPYALYVNETAWFAGGHIGSILYGALVVLFLKCVAALFSPVYRRPGEGIKWGYVSYTVVMFSLATVVTAMNLHTQAISYIDNRNFPGVEGGLPPGPYGYLQSIYFKVTKVIPDIAFLLNNWLSEGLLLYRCYVIYSMNFWAVSFPCLMYLGSVAMGILTICPTGERVISNLWSGTLAYFLISFSLNILLTIMIVVRLALHSRDIHATLGVPGGISRFYKAIITMLIESSALFAGSSLLVIGLMAARSPAANLFFPTLCETQVIAPLLIIQRVASKRALTGGPIVSGSIGSAKAESRGGLSGSDCALPGGYPMIPMDERGTSSCGLGIDTVIDIR